MPENDLNIQLPFTESHAFIIGINNYRNGISTLRSAIKDAKDMAELFGETHGYIVHATYDATREDMYKVFEEMKTVVKPDHRVIFYFAGHGYAFDSEKDPEGFLIPADALQENRESLVPMNDLHSTIKSLTCKHGLLILDCCFSGSFKWSTTRGGFDLSGDEPLYAERFFRFLRNDAWQVITSAAHDQKAIDIFAHQAIGMRDSGGEGDEEPNSPFATALKKAINLEGAADVARGNRSDGVITATELYAYLRDIVETETAKQGKRQTPSIFALNRHDKGEFIFLNPHPRHQLSLTSAPDTNPYMGLKSYTKVEGAYFFGREKAVIEIAKKLETTPILVISAPSGQGKSSTVQAGLFPYLKKQHNYKNLQAIRPGANPEYALGELSQPDSEEKHIILIDQYEEFFSDADYSESHAKFESRMAELLAFAKAGKSKIIITIRSDFEWQLKSSTFGKQFWDDLKVREFLYRLPPMSLEELRQIMIKPAWVVAYDFESDEMVDHILEEINHAPGALPILSFTLNKLYEFRDRENRLLTLDAYENKLGGINGALSSHANEIYDGLETDAHRNIMQKLFLRMIRLNDGSYSRRRVYRSYKGADLPLNELDYPDHLDETVDEVLEKLVDEQLISGGEDETGSYYEPTHDALINFWPKCLEWIKAFGKEHITLQRQLWQAILDYHKKVNFGKSKTKSNVPQNTQFASEFASFLWYNNPKLMEVIQSVIDPSGILDKPENAHLQEGTSLLWNDDVEALESREKIRGSLTWWEKKTKLIIPKELHSGADDKIHTSKILDFVLNSNASWLNEKEVMFVMDSWVKKTEWITKLKTDRDNAIKAQKEAEAARQRTIGEMIEVSWKAGTFLEKTDISGTEGSRKLYQKLKMVMSLSKAKSLSPFKIFVKGPHMDTDDFDLNANSFAYYNPEFVSWARKNVIPAKNNQVLKNLTLPFYRKYMQDMARIYSLTYDQLERVPDLRDQVMKAYLTFVETGHMPVTWVPGNSGGIFFENQFGQKIWPHINDIEQKAGLSVKNCYYHWVVSLGFWIRRFIDTTAEDFKAILDDLLETYDTEWYNNPTNLPDYY